MAPLPPVRALEEAKALRGGPSTIRSGSRIDVNTELREDRGKTVPVVDFLWSRSGLLGKPSVAVVVSSAARLAEGLWGLVSAADRISSIAGRFWGLHISGEARSFSRSSTEYLPDMSNHSRHLCTVVRVPTGCIRRGARMIALTIKRCC